MDNRNLKELEKNAEFQSLHKSIQHNCVVTLVAMMLITFPLIAIAFIFTMFLSAAAGALIHTPSFVLVLFFALLFTLTILALFRTLKEDDEEEEPDIIYGLFGYNKEQEYKEELVALPAEEDPLMY